MTSADHALGRRERRRLALLAVPTFGLALAITIVSTYLPTVARQFTGSTTVIGVLIGGEGLGAILLPVIVGGWSDRLRTPWGGRLPLMVAGTPVAVAALIGMGLVGGLGGLAIAVGLFFVGYFVAYEPYRAFYPDLVDDEMAGRAQSTQAVGRGIGTGFALVAGGILLDQGQAVPFFLAAVVLAASVGIFTVLAVRSELPDQEPSDATVGQTVRDVTSSALHDPPLRAYFIANALWELALGAVKTFVVLWLTVGLGVGLTSASLIIGAAAIPILAGAAVSGKLADAYGRERVMRWGVIAFGAPMVVPLVTTSAPAIVAVVWIIGFGGGMLMSLPYALLQPLMPEERHGALTGFYSASRGVGVMLGPLLGGVAISIFAPVLTSTQGYAAVWGVCGAATLASLPFLARVTPRAGSRAGGAAR